MKHAVGIAMRLLGDLVILATIFFAATIAFIAFSRIEAPDELRFVLSWSQVLTDRLGPLWWAFLLGFGAVAGWTLSRIGRGLSSTSRRRLDRNY